MSTTIACLQGSHAILAHFGGPHWLIDDKDATTYAKAIQNVARHYDVRAAQKTIDWINLCGMIAFIEGTRVLAGRLQKAQPKPPPRGPAQVFQFSPPVTNGAAQPTPPASASPSPQPETFGPPAPLTPGSGEADYTPAPEGPFH